MTLLTGGDSQEKPICPSLWLLDYRKNGPTEIEFSYDSYAEGLGKTGTLMPVRDSDNSPGYLAGDNAAELRQRWAGGMLTKDCLIGFTSCPLFKFKSHVSTSNLNFKCTTQRFMRWWLCPRCGNGGAQKVDDNQEVGALLLEVLA